MVFTVPFKSLTFEDIKQLKEGKYPESVTLDYKESLIDDNDLIKHVSAFANTYGGYIIFGIKETGRGGIPEEINGIDKDTVNKERMEQILIGNIHPRLHVKFSNLIDISESEDKCVLVLQIPNSYLKPHLNSRSKKYYKRYEFESTPMTEIEISDAYKRRFETYRELDKEIDKIKFKLEGPQISGQIIVIPTLIRRDLIDTFDEGNLSWINPDAFEPEPRVSESRYIPKEAVPSANGVKCAEYRRDRGLRRFLEIHRTGAVSHVDVYGPKSENVLMYKKFGLNLLKTLDFARELYSTANYFGNLKVIISLRNMHDASLTEEGYDDGIRCETDKIWIEREITSVQLETNLSYIASNICDELFNHFEKWKCWLFNKDGEIIPENFLPFKILS